MFDAFFTNIKKGFQRIQENHQLGYTILVAIIIFLAFLFVTVQFASIARDAQDRLINVRIGSIHDTFATFATDALDSPKLLQEDIQAIAANNNTIVEFVLVVFTNDDPHIVAALDESRIGTSDASYEFLYVLAQSNPDQSFTTESVVGDSRGFETVRALRGTDGNINAAIRTRQTLSEADRAIDQSIRNSLIFFLVLVSVIMLLFFRHARVLDYAVLYKRLKEIDQLKDDFIAMASHELRTPLTAMHWHLNIIAQSKGLTDEEREYVRRTTISAEQLDDLVSDILDVSRIEQGRMQFEYENFNVVQLVRNTIETLEPRAQEKGLALSVENAEDIQVHADRSKVRQILINFIGNAVKYTEEGNVTVQITGERKKVSIRVSDTGIGMTPEEQEKLFQKFYRVQNAHTKDIRGTGLGLWLSKQLVEGMHGTVTVQSMKGVGTHVTVQLPAVRT